MSNTSTGSHAALLSPPTPRLGSDESGLSELLDAARHGDAVAWQTLVARFDGLLRQVTRRYRLTPEEAADVVQTTWLRLIENVERIRDPDRLGCWLTTTAARAALAVCRRTAEIPLADHDQPDLSSADVHEQVAATLRRRQLLRSLSLLAPRERQVLVMLLSETEPSYREISRRLRMPIGSIGPVRQRALARLRANLDADGFATATPGAERGEPSGRRRCVPA